MFYVLDDNNNKIEAYDKQGVLAVLEQAIEDGDLVNVMADSAFVDKLKCCVGGETHQIAFVTQAVYNQLQAGGQLINNAYYFITDDSTADDINAALDTINNDITTINNRLDALGFREGVAAVTNGTIITASVSNTLKKQGKYCLFSIAVLVEANQTATITIPNGFKPKEPTKITSLFFNIQQYGAELTATTDGTISLVANANYTTIFTIENAGWELA